MGFAADAVRSKRSRHLILFYFLSAVHEWEGWREGGGGLCMLAQERGVLSSLICKVGIHYKRAGRADYLSLSKPGGSMGGGRGLAGQVGGVLYTDACSTEVALLDM